VRPLPHQLMFTYTYIYSHIDMKGFNVVLVTKHAVSGCMYGVHDTSIGPVRSKVECCVLD
jgi:hypothetical protein